jgi:DNA-binding response OmpR family regulator
VYLVENRNRALTRQQILDGVWGIDFFGEDRTVDTHIKMLRERLKPYKHLIDTVWGVGYKLDTGEKRQ